jgi:hypothetical protein
MSRRSHPRAEKSALSYVDFWYADGQLHLELHDGQGNIHSHYTVPCASSEEACALKDDYMNHLRSQGIKPLSDGDVQ